MPIQILKSSQYKLRNCPKTNSEIAWLQFLKSFQRKPGNHSTINLEINLYFIVTLIFPKKIWAAFLGS